MTVTRKGGKVVTIPLAPRTARAIDLAIGERTDGPVFLAADGRRVDRHGAGRLVRKVARRARIGKTVTPHTLRHAFITAALDAGVPLRDVQEAASHADPRTTIRYDRARGSLDRHATYIVAAYVAGAARYTGIGWNSSVWRSRPPDRAPLSAIRSVLAGDATRSRGKREPPARPRLARRCLMTMYRTDLADLARSQLFAARLMRPDMPVTPMPFG